MSAGDPVIDPLAGLLALPGLAGQLSAARDTIDRMRRERSVWRAREQVSGNSRVWGGWANAALEGVHVPFARYAGGQAVDDSPQGSLLVGAGALADAAPRLFPLIGTAPAQVFAELGVIAATACGAGRTADIGRPRSDTQVVDSLHLGPPPAPGELRERLTGIGGVLRTSAAPGLLVAAITHAELACLRPFRVGSGLFGRSVDRLVLAQRGVDPDLLLAPELAIWEAGRTSYVRALQGYATATPVGVGNWISFYCQAIAAHAQNPRQTSENLQNQRTE